MAMVNINPGTGPVDGKKALARAAAEAFRADLGVDGITIKPKGKEWDGRWDFEFSTQMGRCEVSMPGVSVDVLKGDVMRAPRLYVDGSSWWWKFALNIARDILTGRETE
jgi:hypothetical protein